VVSFVLFAALRAGVTGHPFVSEVAPITGPMYQLFIFFMITDPRTSVRPVWGQVLVAFLVAAVESVFRLLEWVHAPYYALFVVGPAANLVEIAVARHAATRAAQVRPTPSASATRLM
jgi:Na+-translocating ferredoxin:NAD+ oxidoreductase RnfD subunit